MKVIFIEDVPNIAKAGEIKDVTDGYGRNYLIPRKLAAIATTKSIAGAKAQLEKKVREQARTEAEMQQLAKEIDGKEISVTARTGGKDKLYGSITPEDIATELQKALGVIVDKRKIETGESIREVGTFDVVIRLSSDIAPTIKVTVKEQETV
jgi:large subunit ribosomal protein L9